MCVQLNLNPRLFQGPLVQEVRQVLGPWASMVVRMYTGENHVEFEFTVGPISER